MANIGIVTLNRKLRNVEEELESLKGGNFPVGGIDTDKIAELDEDLLQLEAKITVLEAKKIGTTDILDNAVIDSKISSVSGNKITNLTITNSQITDGAVTNDKISSVDSSKIAGLIADAQIAGLRASKLTGTLIDSQIAGISSSKISGTLLDSQISAVSANKIAGTIVDTQIANEAITTPKIQDSAVTTNKIQDNAVTDGKISSVSGSKVTGLVVSTSQIADGAVTDPKITSLSYSKLTSVPTAFPCAISSIVKDVDLNMNGLKIVNVMTPSFTEPASVVKNQVATCEYSDFGDTELYDQVVKDNFGIGAVEMSKVPPAYNWLVHWFDMSDAMLNQPFQYCVYSTDGRVNLWYDRKGRSNPLGQSVSTKCPTLVRNETLTSSLRFSSSSFDRLVSTNLSINVCNSGCLYSAVTIFTVVKLNSLPAANQEGCIWSADNGNYQTALAVSCRDGSTSATSTFAFAAYTGPTAGAVKGFRTNNGTGTLVTPTLNQWYLTCVTYHPSTTFVSGVANPLRVSAWLDGRMTINEFNCTGLISSNVFTVGGLRDNVDAWHLDGNIREIAIYNRHLSNGERIAIETYFKNKWLLPFSYTS